MSAEGRTLGAPLARSASICNAAKRMTCPRRYLKSMFRLLPPILLLVAFAAYSAPNALAAPAFYDGISEDGEVAVFSTSEQMVPGDTDQEPDVYVRAFDGTLGELVTREVSIGPRGGNDTRPARYDGLSPDGTKVFFS